MNVLLAAGPESTTLFTITVRESGRPAARLAGQRHIVVPLNRLQSTHRRLLLAGDTILSVTRCQPMGDPPPCPHPDPAPDITESPSPAPVPLVSAPPAEETAPPRLTGQPPQQPGQGQTDEISFGEDAVVLLLSVLGVLILLTLHGARHLAQQWGTNTQARQHPDPPVVSIRTRELANC